MRTAVHAIFKNEAAYLREWIAFHLMQGFDEFVLYDNESTDDWQGAIAPFADRVRVIDYPGTARQLPSYQHFLDHFGSEFRWVAFLDIDEFLHQSNGNSIRLFLDRKQEYACLEARWFVFGPSGHEDQPSGLTIENYTLRANDAFKDDHFKSIVDPRTVVSFSNPHEFEVTGLKERSVGLRVNHYWTRSRQEFAAKIARGRSDIGVRHEDREIRAIDQLSEVRDDELARLWGGRVRYSLDLANTDPSMRLFA